MADRQDSDRKIYFSQLTGLRFFAAYAVVFHHVYPAFSPNALIGNIGDAAVSLFFILSGFVLTISNRTLVGDFVKPRSDYLLGRVARIYPTYVFSFLLAAPSVLYKTFVEHPGFGSAAPRIAGNAIAFLSLLQAWIPWLTAAWNGPGWSLSVEMFFYTSFLFILPPQREKLGLWMAIAAITVVLPVVAFQAGVGPASILKALWYFFPPFRMGDFLLGIGIAQTFRFGLARRLLETWGDWVAALSLGLTIVSLGVLPPVGVRVVLCLLLPLALLSLAHGRGLLTRMLATRPVVLLGDSSYALYLIHVPLVPLYLLATGRNMLAQITTSADFFAYSVIAVGASILVHLWVELPAAAQIKEWWRRRSSGPQLTTALEH